MLRNMIEHNNNGREELRELENVLLIECEMHVYY